ncbi:fimbrial protein [Parabacteroides sp.]
MDNKRLNLLRAVPAVLLLAATLAGCSIESGDAPALPENKTVPVRISIAAETPAGTTKADGTAAIIDPDDRINTLDIYIVDSKGNIEKHVDESDFTFTQAPSAGATTTPIELSPGTKTVYAFANCPATQFADLGLSATWTTVPKAVTNNQPFDVLPAISSENGFPMSACTTWEIEETTVKAETTCTIIMVRMAAQLTVSVKDNRATMTDAVESLTIEGLLPQTTNLFRKGKGEVDLSVIKTTPTSPHDWSTTNIGNIDSFYLHETKSRFNVSVKIANESSPRTTTFTKEIPRNYIIPLIIHVTDYSLEISGTYELAAIGTVAVKTDIGNGYKIELPEGASNIAITVKLKSKSEYIKDGITWSHTPEIAGLTFSNDSEASYLVTGQVPAITGKYPIKLSATLSKTSGNKTLSFDLTIDARALNDDDLTTTTKAVPSSPSGQAEPIIIEL